MQDIWCGMPVVGTNATPMTLSRTSRRARWLIPSVFPLKYPFNRPPFPTMIPRLRRLQTICFAAAAAATSGFPQVLAAAAGSFDPLRPEASGYRLEFNGRSEEHTSELQSLRHLVCRLLLEKQNNVRATESRYHERPSERHNTQRASRL